MSSSKTDIPEKFDGFTFEEYTEWYDLTGTVRLEENQENPKEPVGYNVQDSKGIYLYYELDRVKALEFVRWYNHHLSKRTQLSMSSLESQQGGDHYKNKKIQPIEFISSENLPYALGAAVKHISRRGQKPGNDLQTDMMKAIHYIQLYLELDHGIKTTTVEIIDEQEENK